MGALEQVHLRKVTGPTSLRTFRHAVPFVLSSIDHHGIVLLLGDGDHLDGVRRLIQGCGHLEP